MASPHRHFPNVVAGSALLVFIMIARKTSATVIRVLWGEKRGNAGPGGYLAGPASHREAAGRVRECGPLVMPLLGLRVECLGLHGFTLHW